MRCREVGKKKVRKRELVVDRLVYEADSATEHFISFVTPDDRLAGFVRLSLPHNDDLADGLEDLSGAARIRELHVYGQSLPVGEEKEGAAQHSGLGTRLLEYAEEAARNHGFTRMAVISAVGTRKYYEGRGYLRGRLYQVKDL